MIDMINVDLLQLTMDCWGAISGFKAEGDNTYSLILDFNGDKAQERHLVKKHSLDVKPAVYGGIIVRNWESFLSEVFGQEFCSEVLYELYHNVVDLDLELAMRNASKNRNSVA
ncbi:hypothetical protein L1O48_05680 [Ligilactobacillus equi]|uniref:hypothetical protein n=1 Tax=Ligilactobacillus equi TaxID=137357 RepID=UPI002ED0B829